MRQCHNREEHKTQGVGESAVRRSQFEQQLQRVRRVLSRPHVWAPQVGQMCQILSVQLFHFGSAHIEQCCSQWVIFFRRITCTIDQLSRLPVRKRLRYVNNQQCAHSTQWTLFYCTASIRVRVCGIEKYASICRFISFLWPIKPVKVLKAM